MFFVRRILITLSFHSYTANWRLDSRRVKDVTVGFQGSPFASACIDSDKHEQLISLYRIRSVQTKWFAPVIFITLLQYTELYIILLEFLLNRRRSCTVKLMPYSETTCFSLQKLSFFDQRKWTPLIKIRGQMWMEAVFWAFFHRK